jgi:hypothetical protein
MFAFTENFPARTLHRELGHLSQVRICRSAARRGRRHRGGRSDSHLRRSRALRWRGVHAAPRQKGMIVTKVRRLMCEHDLQPKMRRRFTGAAFLRQRKGGKRPLKVETVYPNGRRDVRRC